MANVSGGSVIWDLDVDSKQLSSGLSDARNEVKTTADQVDKSMDGVKKSTKSAGESFRDFANSAVMGATVITGALGLIANSAIQLGADYQSARVSFETFLQSGEKAGKLLSDLGEFASKTPFDLPQVVEGSKRLLAYGIEAEKIIPTFRMLGDLSSGNKVKLDQLTLAYGQVRAATKLTGAELRQFTEAGIPLLDALAAEFNKNGGAMVAVGGASKKAKVDIGELNDKLSISKKRLEEATRAGKSKESTMMSLKNTVQNYEQKLSAANATGGDAAKVFKKVKVTAAEVKDMISDGGVTFAQVDSALQRLTASGGMFFNNMANQSKTFGGVMSNVGDEIKRFALESLGFFISGDQAGTVREGSIFASLQKAAEGFLNALITIRPIATAFVDGFLQNQVAVNVAVGALLGLLTPLAIAFATMIAPALAFAAAGAAIAFVVSTIIEKLGGWTVVQAQLNDAFKRMGELYVTLIKPSLDSLWQTIQDKLLPPLQQLWTQISPILIPALKALGVLLGGFLYGSFLIIVEILKVLITWVGDTITKFNQLIEFFKGIPDAIRSAFSGVKDAITKPFEDAWSKVSEIAAKIKDKMDQISPFHRNSPSLVDKVNMGVDVIKAKFGTLKDIDFPRVSDMGGSDQGFYTEGFDSKGETNNTYSSPAINVNIGSVQNKSDIDMISREIGFRASLLPAV